MAQWLYNGIVVIALVLRLVDNIGLTQAVNGAILLCNTSKETCYEAKYVNDPMTWEDARDVCEADGGALPDGHLHNAVNNGNMSSGYAELLQKTTTWTSHVKKKSENKICVVHKLDAYGLVRRKKSDCHKIHPFLCLYPQDKTNTSDVKLACPPASWVYCPEPRMKVVLGDSLRLRCEHTTAFDTCEWRLKAMIFRSSSLSFDSVPGVSVVNDTSCELHIPVFGKEHIGVWQCQGYGNEYVNVALFEKEAPKPPSLWVNDESSSIVRIHENDNNTVTCRARGDNVNMKIVLMNDGVPRMLPMVRDTSHKNIIISTSVLPSRHEMEAFIYCKTIKVICITSSSNGNTSRTTHLDLLYAPRIYQVSNIIYSEVGQRLEYSLRLRANPKPTDVYLDIITTSTQHVRLYPGNHYYMKQKYELSDLKTEDSLSHQYKIDFIVHQLQANDSHHDYWFVAKNEEGESKINFTIEYKSIHTQALDANVQLEYLVEEKVAEEEEEKEELSGASTAAFLLSITALVLGLATIAAIYTYNRRKRRLQRKEKMKDAIQVNGKDTTDENCNRTVSREWSCEEDTNQLLSEEQNGSPTKIDLQ